MNTAKLFINGRSQAIRLPKEYRFEGTEVFINKIDDVIVLFPKNKPWDSFIKSLDKFTDDFMEERNQLEYDKREHKL